MSDMQNEIYQQEPNLIAEAYRNYAYSQTPRRIEKHFDFIDISEDGYFCIGTSNLCGRIWSGSIWIFKDYHATPKIKNCLAGIEFHSSVASGLWMNANRDIFVGCDSGALHHLALNNIENKKKCYFATEGLVSEHDDSITCLDLLENKNKILSGSMDMNIKVWDPHTLACEKSYCPAHGHIVTSVSTLSDSSNTFLSTSLDGTTLIWDMRLEKPASLLLKNECGFTASAWLDEYCVSVGSNDGSVSLVDLKMKTEFDRNFTAKRPIFKVKYNAQLDLLAVCADDPFVRILSCNERSLTNVYESEQHTDFVRGLAWSPCSKTLYSCGWDSKIYSHEISNFEGIKADEINSVEKS